MGLAETLRYVLFGEPSSSSARRKLGKIRGRIVSVSTDALRHHTFVVGASGLGKSRLLRTLIEQDIRAGHGVCLVDPHGDLCEDIVAYLAQLKPGHRARRRALLIEPTAPAWAVGFNPLQVPEGQPLYPHVLELIEVFHKQWDTAWGARMEDIMRHCFVSLVENDLTLLELPRLLTDEGFRAELTEGLTSQEARDYWQYRFNPLARRTRADWIESTLNKVSAFISDPWIRDMVGQTRSTITPRSWMDDGAVVLINLAKGRLKTNSNLIGALLVSILQQTAMARVDVPPSQRRPFRMYVDEFQDYATRSFEEILSEARKYGLPLVMACQLLEQLHPVLRASVLTNAEVQIYFRLSRQDADQLARQAFRATGKNIKFQLEKESWFNHEPRANPVYVGVGEEMEGYVNCLLDLGRRQAVLNARGEGPPTPFITAEAPDRSRLSPDHPFRQTLLRRLGRPRHEVRQQMRARTQETTDEPVTYWQPES